MSNPTDEASQQAHHNGVSASAQSSVAIQDIVVYGNSPPGFTNVMVLEEGAELPGEIDATSLIIQRKGNDLCVSSLMGNKLVTTPVSMSEVSVVGIPALRDILPVVDKLPKNQKLFAELKDDGKIDPDGEIFTLISRIKGKYGCKQLPPTGEFNDAKADISNQQDRLFQNIENLILTASSQHRANYCNEDGTLKSESQNNITRLVTNEFSFYTKKPLTIQEFETLSTKISEMAAQQPENLHLILSSFAVRTSDNQIMNVVAHVECGREPRINLIVKNHPSDIDPVYTETVDNRRRVLTNFNIEENDNPELHQININCVAHKFSYNNVFECSTPGGGKFYSCVDICSDHARGVAKKNLISKLKGSSASEPLAAVNCSHVVTSNYINPQRNNILGPLTHADPYVSHKACKQGQENANKTQVTGTVFGTEQNMTITSPAICSPIPQSVVTAVNANQLEDFIHKTLIDSDQGTKENAKQFSEYLRDLNIKSLNEIDVEALKKEKIAVMGGFEVELRLMSNPNFNDISTSDAKIPTLIKDDEANIWVYGQNAEGEPNLTKLELNAEEKQLVNNLNFEEPPSLLKASQLDDGLRNIIKKGYHHIKPQELPNSALLDNFTTRANRLANIVASDLLNAQSEDHQKRIFSFYAEAAKNSYEAGDLETAISLSNALTQQPIYRLDYLLDNEMKDTLDEMRFIGRKNNQAKYDEYKRTMADKSISVIDSTPKIKFELAQLEGKKTVKDKSAALESLVSALLPSGKIIRDNAFEQGNDFETKVKKHTVLDDNKLYAMSEKIYAKPKNDPPEPRVPHFPNAPKATIQDGPSVDHESKREHLASAIHRRASRIKNKAKSIESRIAAHRTKKEAALDVINEGQVVTAVPVSAVPVSAAPVSMPVSTPGSSVAEPRTLSEREQRHMAYLNTFEEKYDNLKKESTPIVLTPRDQLTAAMENDLRNYIIDDSDAIREKATEVWNNLVKSYAIGTPVEFKPTQPQGLNSGTATAAPLEEKANRKRDILKDIFSGDQKTEAVRSVIHQFKAKVSEGHSFSKREEASTNKENKPERENAHNSNANDATLTPMQKMHAEQQRLKADETHKSSNEHQDVSQPSEHSKHKF